MSTAAKTLDIEIGAPVAEVVAYVADVPSLPLWATDFCQEIHLTPHGANVLTPAGWARLSIKASFAAGTVDLIVEGPEPVAQPDQNRPVTPWLRAPVDQQ